jgi:hypothetical protein
VSEKSLAVRYLRLFFLPEGTIRCLPDHRSRPGGKKFKKPAQAEAVGGGVWEYDQRYGKPTRKFRLIQPE